jgi:hypothetical protein
MKCPKSLVLEIGVGLFNVLFYALVWCLMKVLYYLDRRKFGRIDH